MGQIEKKTIIIGGDVEFFERLPEPLKMQASAYADSVFNLARDQEDDVVKHLGMRYRSIDIVLDVDTLTTHRSKVLALLKGIIEKNTPILDSVQALYMRDMNVEFLCEVLTFCGKRRIPFTVTRPSELQDLLEPSSLRSLLATGPYNVVQMIIDRKSVGETQFLKSSRTFIPVGLPQTLHDHKIVDERYWYWDEKGAALWLYLKDSKNYPFFTETYEVLQSKVAHIRDIIFKRLSQNRTATIDVVAIGVGSAEKELLVLRAMLDEYRRRGARLRPPMYYIPMDISFPLLQNSIRLMFSDSSVRNQLEQRNLVVRPILTDFLETPRQLIATQNEGKLITALGMLTNVSREGALAALHTLMDNNMLLLIDVELIGGRINDDLIKEYSSDEVSDFLYHPVDMLCAGAASERFATQVRGRFSEVNYDYFRPYSREAGDIFVDVIDDNDMSALEARHGVPAVDVRGFYSLSDAKNSKVIVIMFKPHNEKAAPIIIGYSAKYEYGELKDCLKSSGFELIEEYLNNPSEPTRSSFGYFLLRRIEKKKS
jgi:hypothetical protein